MSFNDASTLFQPQPIVGATTPKALVKKPTKVKLNETSITFSEASFKKTGIFSTKDQK